MGVLAFENKIERARTKLAWKLLKRKERERENPDNSTSQEKEFVLRLSPGPQATCRCLILTWRPYTAAEDSIPLLKALVSL